MNETPMKQTPMQNVEPLLLKCAEAAKMLTISPRTLSKLAKSGEVKRIKIGSSVRYHPRDLRAWIEWKRANAHGELAKAA